MPKTIPTKVVGSDLPIQTAEVDATTNVVTPTKEDLSLLPSNSTTDEADSQGSDQPWDVQRTMSEEQGSYTNNNTNDQTIKAPMANMLSGRRTVRPLAAPSTNGMMQYRSPSQDEYDYEDDGTRETMEDLEDMPMDERKEYQRQRAILCGAAVIEDDGEDPSNLCEYTLSALGDMCGTTTTTPALEDSGPQAIVPAARRILNAKVPSMKAPYGVEEQTAIEVEYVEPSRPTSGVAAATTPSPKRKSMLVQAMARRAKQDYERTTKSKPTAAAAAVTTTTTTTTSSAALEKPPDNAYATFSPAEKRQFLKLINSGMSPSDANDQVLREREQQPHEEEYVDVEEEEEAYEPREASAIPAPATPTRKGASKSAAPPSNTKSTAGFAKSGIGYYDGDRRERKDDEDLEEILDGTLTSNNNNTDKKKKKRRMLGKFGFARLSAGDKDDQVEKSSPKRKAETSPSPPRAQAISASQAKSTPSPTATTSAAPKATPPTTQATARSFVEPSSPKSVEPTSTSRGAFIPVATAAAVSATSTPRQASTPPTRMAQIQENPSDDSLFHDTEEPPEKPLDESLEQEMKETLFAGVVTPKRYKVQKPVNLVELDVDVTYMNSTELVTHVVTGGASVAGGGDQRSVVSGKSHKTTGTYGTMGTNYTQSTRTRRPGAVKQRLSSQKTGETAPIVAKIKGWQESMQEAAATIEREWDPVKGWIGYVEPDMPTEKEPVIVHIGPVATKIRVPHSGDDDSQEVQVFVDEEDDDEDQVRENTNVQQRALHVDPPTVPSAKADPPREVVQSHGAKDVSPESMPVSGRSVTPSRTRGVTGENDVSPAKSRGWMESMKAATSRINTQGKRWDPERGWVGLEDEEMDTSGSARYDGNVTDQVESDTQDFGMAVVAAEQDTLGPLPTLSQVARDPSGQLPVNPPPRQDPTGKVLDDDDHISVDGSAKSGVPGRYMQIGDTGSVSSYYYGKPSVGQEAPATAPDQSMDSAPSRDPEGQPQREPLLVDVKKERMNSADADMFPEVTRNTRRSTGPVDLDEVDDMHAREGLEDGSFGVPPDFSWDEDGTNVSEMLQQAKPTRNPVPRLQVNIRDVHQNVNTMKSPDSKTTSEISFGSVSTSKSIPRLRGPKRDTSPIRGRGASSTKSTQASVQMNAPLESPRIKTTVSPNPALDTPGKSPGLANDTRTTYTAESSPSTGSVKDLHQLWERRSHGEVAMPSSTDWKSLLAKRESSNEKAGQRRMEEDRDSLFDFNESEGAFPTGRAHREAVASPTRDNGGGLRSLEEISDLSPIRTVHDDDDENDDDEAPSEVSTGVAQGTTFLQRLQACAAPMMPTSGTGGTGMPMAHLAFMRTNPAATGSSPEKGVSRFMPPSLCGKPDVIVEEDDYDDLALEENSKRSESKKLTARSLSSSRGKQSNDVSSVISDEQFGQKTAYLEAIAMKAAVSSSRKKKSRSTGSEASTSTGHSSKPHSDSWQRFLDKKKAATQANQSDKEEVSKAAEQYAMEKVEEMMEAMAARSRDYQARPDADDSGAFPTVKSARAAEDLAAARVDAMIQALSNQEELDEGEGEI